MKLPHRPLTALFTALALLGPGQASAPATDFTPGELILYSPAVNGGSSTSGAVVRIDPVTGTVNTIVNLTGHSQSYAGSMCYDPYRDRLIFLGALDVLDPKMVFSCDSAGNLTSLNLDGRTLTCLAPGAGGKIYTVHTSPGQSLRYLDANNNLVQVLDAAGAQPWMAPQWSVRAMIYDPGTNALFMVTQAFSSWSCGPAANVHVHRLALSTDGTRVLSEDLCSTMQVDPSGGNVPVGISRTPGGQILVVVDTNSNATQPRMQLVDPVSGAVSPFASNGNIFAAATNAGTYSSALGRAVVLDTGNNVLRSFGLGEVGDGIVITPSSQISSAGGTGEVATLVEVPMNSSANLYGSYCSAKMSSSGCLPTMVAFGAPSASDPSGFDLGATQVEAQRFGLLFYGQSGPSAAPFLGGTLCVATPIQRTVPQFSGGTSGCDGSFSFDFNTHVQSGVDPSLTAGSVVHSQYWFRDPLDAFGVGLTNAITFTLAP